MEKLYKIIETDNFGGDYPNEEWATPYLFSREDAAILRECFNSLLSGDRCPRYWREVPEDYELQPGQEALFRILDYAKHPRCPSCGSERLEWTSEVSFNGSFIAQDVVCENCGTRHEAIYTLSDYEEKP